ncbi:MAG: DoxX family protein [Chitinophagaceae bacterium]
MKSLFTTNPNNYAALIIRLTIGLVLFPHGAQKAFGMFGGNGFQGTMDFLTGAANLPYIVALAVIFVELVGAICLILGFATRFFAFAVLCLMIGIIYTTHLPNGFFMNWTGKQAGEGYEFHLLMIGLSLAALISGGGKASIDSTIGRRRIY